MPASKTNPKSTTRSKSSPPQEPRRRIISSVEWEAIEPSSTIVRVPYRPSKDWQQTFLLASDRHWDNPHSDQDMQKRHLDEMVERDAYLIDNGDFFCAMQGRFDKRQSKSDIRPEHQHGDYLDRLVSTAKEYFKPYGDRFILSGVGNHEQSIKDRHETSLTQRFVGLMNEGGAKVIVGGFGGFIKFAFRINSPNGAGNYQNVVLHYDHGYGGGGPVTRDMIQHQRRQVYLPDADIIISGHTHDQWSSWVARVRLNQSGKIQHDVVLHIKTPTYKEEYGSGHSGWHSTTGKPPKMIGAYWLTFKYRNEKIVFDVERAV